MSTPAEAVSVNAPTQEQDTPAATLEREVKKQWDEYAVAQAFDFNARRQYERDRRYAAGTADISYAVDANLLGSYIDILVSYIYARNPKVSVRPAEQVEVKYEAPIDPTDPMAAVERFQDAESRRKRNIERQAFAKTLQIVITRLWQEGRLKQCMKKVVRSGYAVAVGWFKAALLVETKTDPQVQTAINDLRDNVARIAKLQRDLAGELDEPGVEREDVESDLELHVKGLESQLEVILRKALAIDFCSAEHMQVSLDVRDIEDHLEASWNANAMFITKDDAKIRFPDVNDEQWKLAQTYLQREPTNYQTIDAIAGGAAESVEIDPKGEAYQYTKSTGGSDNALSRLAPGGKPVEYIKAVEKWDRRDNSIKTLIEGLKVYAKEPFSPKFATSRYYPYFQVIFFPVDGDRHPQSLSWRLAKLQDEYAASRSSFRLTRERSIPGIIVNGAQVGPEEMAKLQKGTQSEYIVITLTEPERPVSDAFAQKPIPTIDPMLFDNALIIGDMEKLSGVQEALQTSQTVDKTATQAEIEQGGFAARTTAARDCVEVTLSDFALYTAELALQGITAKEAEVIAGPYAFWPTGMPIQAVTQYLNVDIEAGSTGRPNTTAEREAWTALLPELKEMIAAVLTARAQNNEPIAQVYIELLRETLTRFDDRLDVDRFVPTLPPMPQIAMPAAGGGGAAPGAQGPSPGGGAPALPGAPDPGAAGAPLAPGATDPLAAAA